MGSNSQTLTSTAVHQPIHLHIHQPIHLPILLMGSSQTQTSKAVQLPKVHQCTILEEVATLNPKVVILTIPHQVLKPSTNTDQ